jgi:hypothetical protein
LGTLSEPRRKQNLYANPKRTAKSFFTLPLFRRPRPKKVQFIFQKTRRTFFTPGGEPPLDSTSASYAINRLVTN